MQRGRSIQFAMEKFLRDGKNFQGMKQLQLETQKYFQFNTFNVPKWIAKRHSKAINQLVRVSINLLRIIEAKNLILKRNRIFFKIRKKRLIPDFFLRKLKINSKVFRNLPAELKVISNKNLKTRTQAIKQAAKYSSFTRKPCLLIFIVLGNFSKKAREFEVFQSVFLVNKYNKKNKYYPENIVNSVTITI